MEDSQIAAALCAQLAERIGTHRYELWFTSQTKLCVHEGRLTVLTASVFLRDWLRNNFGDDLSACWDAIAGAAQPIEFEVDAISANGNSAAAEIGAVSDQEQPHEVRVATLPAQENGRQLNVKSGRGDRTANGHADCRTAETVAEFEGPRGAATLSGFVVGPSNEYAYRAAELTARGRQQASPVLFCGATGVGKTHLLKAILREYRRHHPRAAAVYLSAEQFTTNFVEAIRGSGLPSFRQKCRGARLLLIDDVQFFAGKHRTLEELQHTVDTLLADGRQLVMGSDRSLAELRALGPELTSRLSGGLTCEIEPPEFVTRVGILRASASDMSLVVGDDVLRAVATQITAGARELRGALYRLQAMSAAYDQPVTRELADKVLADLARHSTRAVRLADVEQAVCDVFGVEPVQLRSDRKGRAVSEPRMLAMWLARKYTRAAWSEIGEFFGRRSHSTVIAAHRRVERLISTQAEIGVSDRTCNVEVAIRKLEAALRSA